MVNYFISKLNFSKDVPVATVESKLIYRNSTFSLKISIPNMNQHLFKFKVYAEFVSTLFATKQTFGTVVPHSDYIDVKFSDFTSIPNGATNGKIFLSYNDGFVYHQIVSDMKLVGKKFLVFTKSF